MSANLPPIADDAALAALLRKRPDEGLRQLLRAYGGRVRGVLRHKFAGALDEGQMDEALNEAAFRVWRKFDAEKGPVGAWFVRMAWQAGVDVLRRELRRPALSLDELAEEPWAPGVPSDGGEDFAEPLRAAIASLPKRQRAVIEADLAADGKARTIQLAETLRTSPSSISRSRQRAYRRLKELLLKDSRAATVTSLPLHGGWSGWGSLP